jgi:hypothetical protein
VTPGARATREALDARSPRPSPSFVRTGFPDSGATKSRWLGACGPSPLSVSSRAPIWWSAPPLNHGSLTPERGQRSWRRPCFALPFHQWWNRAERGGMIGTCSIWASIISVGYVARGLRAGAHIAVLGGPRAERRA